MYGRNVNIRRSGDAIVAQVSIYNEYQYLVFTGIQALEAWVRDNLHLIDLDPAYLNTKDDVEVPLAG